MDLFLFVGSQRSHSKVFFIFKSHRGSSEWPLIVFVCVNSQVTSESFLNFYQDFWFGILPIEDRLNAIALHVAKYFYYFLVCQKSQTIKNADAIYAFNNFNLPLNANFIFLWKQSRTPLIQSLYLSNKYPTMDPKQSDYIRCNLSYWIQRLAERDYLTIDSPPSFSIVKTQVQDQTSGRKNNGEVCTNLQSSSRDLRLRDDLLSLRPRHTTDPITQVVRYQSLWSIWINTLTAGTGSDNGRWKSHKKHAWC